MARQYFLINASGKDRPGIVAGVTKALYDLGGNLEDTSMTRLGGEFTMMVVAGFPSSVPPAKVQKVLRPLEKTLSLHLHSKPIPLSLAHASKRKEPQYLISVYGTDHPGIIYEVAKSLAQMDVSITDLNTKTVGTSAKPLYVMLLEVQTPPHLDLDALRGSLDDLRKSLRVEITLQDIDPVAL